MDALLPLAASIQTKMFNHNYTTTSDGSQYESGLHGCLCVGEPWNAQLLNEGLGYSALTTGEI